MDRRRVELRWVPERLRDTGGIALAVAVFALVILAAIVAGGYYSAAQEFQIGRGMRSFTTSFYAAETGIQEVVESWDPSVFNSMAAGDSLIVGPVMLDGGGSYTATVVRVGAVPDSTKRYFYIESTGRPRGPRSGERRQAAIARVRLYDFCCEAGVKNWNRILFATATQPQISGLDSDPPGAWPATACTDYPPDSVPGAMLRDQSRIDDPSLVEGWPLDYVEDPSITRDNLFVLGDLTYDDLVKMADHTFTGAKSFSGSRPSVTAAGKCDRSDPDNWGAPEDPSHPCFNYFPIIHVTGSLSLVGNGSAQGILLVGVESFADLQISGPFDFYGLAFVKDDMEMKGPVRFFGGAVVAEDVRMQNVRPRFRYSRCAIQRALRLSRLAYPELLPARAWMELF